MTKPGADFSRHSDKIDAFYARETDGVFYVSHASILVSLNGKRFLFDPVLAKPPHLGSWLFYPEMEVDKRLLEVDAVFVSHQHRDHFDPEFLRMLPATTPVYIMADRPQFEAELKDEGVPFTTIATDTVVDLGSGVTCAGIIHEYNGIDAAIAISNGRFTVYHGNDCFVSNDKLAVIKSMYPTIDVACVPFAYVHWYPFLLEAVDEAWKAREATRLIDKYLDEGLNEIAFLDAKVAIPFGANMFYADDIQSDHNKAVLSPFDFKAHAEKTGFPLKDRIFPLFAGDAVYSLGDASRTLSVDRKAFSQADLFAGFNAYLQTVREVGLGLDFQHIEALTFDDLKDLSFIAQRIAPTAIGFAHNIYISNQDRPDWGLVEISLRDRAVARVDAIDPSKPYNHFRLTDLAYKAYFSREFSFNEIVASSRFRLHRDPNEYILDVLKVVNNVL